jgi:hypothetical protein
MNIGGMKLPLALIGQKAMFSSLSQTDTVPAVLKQRLDPAELIN